MKFFICWMFSDIRNKSEYKQRRRNEQMELHAVENQTILYDDIDGAVNSPEHHIIKPTTPIIFRVITFWSYFECLVLVLVLIYASVTKPKNNYYDNFLHGFCVNEKCSTNNIVTKTITYKLVVAILLFIGCETVRWNAAFSHVNNYY